MSGTFNCTSIQSSWNKLIRNQKAINVICNREFKSSSCGACYILVRLSTRRQRVKNVPATMLQQVDKEEPGGAGNCRARGGLLLGRRPSTNTPAVNSRNLAQTQGKFRQTVPLLAPVTGSSVDWNVRRMKIRRLWGRVAGKTHPDGHLRRKYFLPSCSHLILSSLSLSSILFSTY